VFVTLYQWLLSLPQLWLLPLLYNSSGYSVHVFLTLYQWLLVFPAAVAVAVTLEQQRLFCTCVSYSLPVAAFLCRCGG
jgi:hypothetical protein